MKNAMKTLMVVGLSLATLAGSLVPAQALPISAPKIAQSEQANSVIDVQYYDGYRRGPPRGYGRDRDWRRDREWRRDRRNRDVLLPLGALAAGAIIGGALAQPRETYRPVPEYRHNPEYAPRPVYRGNQGQAHVNWCAGRYRSYDYRSNTFQPYHGPRQTCYSPYN